MSKVTDVNVADVSNKPIRFYKKNITECSKVTDADWTPAADEDKGPWSSSVFGRQKRLKVDDLLKWMASKSVAKSVVPN